MSEGGGSQRGLRGQTQRLPDVTRAPAPIATPSPSVGVAPTIEVAPGRLARGSEPVISLRKTEPLVAAKPTGEYVLHRRAQPVPSDRVVLPRPRKTPPPPTVGASRMPDGQVRITANGTTLVVSASEARLLADLLAGLVF